jgi:acetyl esterase/lipase
MIQHETFISVKVVIFLLILIPGFETCSAQSGKNPVIPFDTSYTPYQTWLKIRKDFPYAVVVKDSLSPDILGKRDLIYATLENTRFGKRDLHLDLFRPVKSGKYPTVVMIHGGGWRSGNKSMQVPLAQRIAAKGFVTAAVEYQLSPESGYPAAVHNIKAAIRWLRANADKFGIDTSRIVISGCSAGGQLAALVGMTNGIDKFEGDQGNNSYSSSVKAVIDIDGVLDFMAPTSLNLQRNPDSPDIAWLGGSFYEKPSVWKEASAIFWVNKNSVPVLFVNSGYSRFHSGQDEMIGIMKELRIYSEVHIIDVKVHPFWLFHPWFNMTVDYMVDFMNYALR